MSVATELSIGSARKAFFALAAVLYSYRVSFGEVEEAELFFREVFELKSNLQFREVYSGTRHLSPEDLLRCRKILTDRLHSPQGEDLSVRKPLSGKITCLDVSVLGDPKSWSDESKECLEEAMNRNNWGFGGYRGISALLSQLSPSSGSPSSSSSSSPSGSRRPLRSDYIEEVEARVRESEPTEKAPRRRRETSMQSREKKKASFSSERQTRTEKKAKPEEPQKTERKVEVGADPKFSTSALSHSSTIGVSPPIGIRPAVSDRGVAAFELACSRKRIEFLRKIYDAILACGIANFSPIDAAVIVASRTGIALDEELIPAINGGCHLSSRQAEAIGRSFPELSSSAIVTWTNPAAQEVCS
jgi:hypothetical protein